MGPSLIALLVLQGEKPAPPPTRELRNGLQRNYRAVIEQETGDGFSYKLNVRVTMPKAASGKTSDAKLELKLTNYKAIVDGRSLSMGKAGGGVLDLGTNGLPLGLEIAGPQGPVWLPMLAFYDPGKSEEGDFVVERTVVGTGMSVVGKGTISHPDKTPSLAFDMSLVRGETVLGKVALTTTLDDKGWPKKADGTLKSSDGTYHFTLTPG